MVGGGPAGAATALTLAGLGLRPTVLEAAAGPRWKVGESLPPSVNPVLDRLGLGAGVRRTAQPSYGNRSVWGSSDPVERDFVFGSAGPGWRLDRAAFEAELAGTAIVAGVDWRWGCRLVSADRRVPRGWVLGLATGGGAGTVEADVVVDASGRPARLARLLGVRRVRYDRLLAAAAYLPLSRGDAEERDSTTLVEAAPFGWWYSLFLPGDRLAVAYLTDADLLDRAGLRRSSGLAAALDSAPTTAARVGSAGGAGPWDGPFLRPAHTARLTQVAGPDWLAVGEAAVTVDPLTSYGIASALGTGFYAAAAVVDHLGGRADALTGYAGLIDQAFAQYLILRQDRYAADGRWPGSEFWRRRQGVGAPDALPLRARDDPGLP